MSYSVGQRLVVAEVAVREFADLTEELANNLILKL